MNIVSLCEYRDRREIARTNAAVAAVYRAPLVMGRAVQWWLWSLSSLVLLSGGVCAVLMGMAVAEHAPR